MSGLLRTVVVIIAGFILAISAGFIAAPWQAIAPSKIPHELPFHAPEPATTTSEKTEHKTGVLIHEDTVPPPEPPAPQSPKPTGILTPGTPEYEKSLRYALEELAKLNIAQPAPPNANLSLNDRVRQAVVNILCTSKSGGALNSISASGVIVDSKGVILTNAHVGQYFLLRDYPTPGFLNCIIRTGSPAYPAYTAELLYLPPSWIANNAEKIDNESPTGNGEHDYALVRITGHVNSDTSFFASFPHLDVSYAESAQGDNVLVVGYAAGFLGGIGIAKDLYAASSYATVREFYTYGGNTADLFSLGGSIVAQQGSSGGAVTDLNGNLIGLVVTSTMASDTASRDLRALTLSYISRDFQKESGMSFAAYLSGDIAAEAAAFAHGVAPILTKALVNVLEK